LIHNICSGQKNPWLLGRRHS